LFGNRETILHSFKGTRRRKTWDTGFDQGFGEHEQPQDPPRMNDKKWTINQRINQLILQHFIIKEYG
jgi:hypothetical protein